MTIVEGRTEARAEWMSSREASSLMGVSPATLRRWSDAGRIRTFTTIGGHRRFSRTAIADLLAVDTAGGPPTEAEREPTRSIADLATTALVEPSARRALQFHARRIITALIAASGAVNADVRTFVLGDAEASAAAWGAIGARSGLGLCETVEALLELRPGALQAIVDANPATGRGEPGLIARIETASATFDRLVCAAMRAHGAVTRIG